MIPQGGSNQSQCVWRNFWQNRNRSERGLHRLVGGIFPYNLTERTHMTRSDDTCANQEQERAVPNIGLAKASVFLAVFLEVIPVEGDAVYAMLNAGQIVRAIVFKILCLMLIFMPLIVYVSRNGLGALKIVRGRVVIVCLITLVNLAGTLLLVYGHVAFGGAAMPK